MMNNTEVFTAASTLAAKNILCVGTGWFPTSPGGLNRYVYDLTRHWVDRHGSVELCGLDLPESPGDSAIKLTNLGSANQRLPQRLWSVRQRFLQRQSQPPDAINLHFALYSFPLMGLLPDVPITFTFHGPWALESQVEGANNLSVWLKQKLVEQSVYRQCDRFIVLSEAFGDILHKAYGIPEHKIHQIPGGVDLERFQPSLTRSAARSQLGWANDRFILFTTRRLVQRMGIDKLLTALAQIKSSVPDFWLAIAGRGAMQETLVRQVAELELTNHVRFLGFLPDEQLPIAYQAADLSVVPSQSLEGFGLILLESLAAGTPVLCTPVGGMPEIIKPFSPELVTASAEVDSIAERLSAIITGSITLPTRSDCRSYAQTNFDWNSIAQQVGTVLLK